VLGSRSAVDEALRSVVAVGYTLEESLDGNPACIREADDLPPELHHILELGPGRMEFCGNLTFTLPIAIYQDESVRLIDHSRDHGRGHACEQSNDAMSAKDLTDEERQQEREDQTEFLMPKHESPDPIVLNDEEHLHCH